MKIQSINEIPKIRLTKHFTLKEICNSSNNQNVVNNVNYYLENEDIRNNVLRLCFVLEDIREFVISNNLQKCLRLSCALRSPTHNSSLSNASKTSHHLIGLAADIIFDSLKVKDRVYRALYNKDVKVDYDNLAQVIYEYNPRGGHWIHVGVRPKDWTRGLEYLYCPNDRKIWCNVKKTNTLYPWITKDNIDSILTH